MYKEIVPFFFTFFDDYVNGNEQQFGGCILQTTKRNKRKSSSPFLFFQHHICPHHLVYKTSTAYNQKHFGENKDKTGNKQKAPNDDCQQIREKLVGW